MLPVIKVRREDVLRREEIDLMLERAGEVYMGERLQCIIALAWLFGKRIKEILRIRREDVWTDDKYLYVRFLVEKKRSRGEFPISRFYTKKINLSNPYVPYVLNWINKVSSGYLFPGNTKPRILKVKAKYRDSTGRIVEKEYYYKLEGGHLSDARLRQLIKEINPKAYWHLFRESLATHMAEHGATEEELMHWFDWSDPRIAHEYIKRGTKLIEKWADRTW